MYLATEFIHGAFDYNSNGRVEFDDIVLLFWEM